MAHLNPSKWHFVNARTAFAIAAISLCIGVALLAGAYYVLQRQLDEQNHRWCNLLTAIDYPRGNASGDKFRNALIERERDYGCLK